MTRRVPTRLLATLAATTLSVATLVALAPAASAAPDCAKVEHSAKGIWQRVTVTNNCRNNISYVVRRAHGPDSKCTIVPPRHQHYFEWARYGARWQGMRWDCA
ncbi:MULTISPECIES: hypothetical protein [unclassified Crossiella]|uniref:hypothetical protein n=1 Tax=unclassified Crossiella TaxID=2620835 RepID=UPI001FFECC79|nr:MULTISPECIES: hypothetical protein [unclassified Crossiella]MCK2244534.1 hypothetical protein [Crossiella sp. S99.2]MCK2258165.1 hypothetical protein [Crossiella sp. S99.1]